MVPVRWQPLRRALGVALALGFLTVARGVAPDVTSVSPAGGQRGREVELTLRGARLADARELFFYREGLSVAGISAAQDKSVVVRVRIAPDAPLGEHPLRLRTAGGVSPLRVFFVGPFPVVAEKEPNNVRTEAQFLTAGSTVEGTLAADDIDHFALEAAAGERVSFEVEGARLGRTMLDPILTVWDPSGRRVARGDDSPLLGHDAFVSFLAPTAGRYVVELRDVAYVGAGHAYRLHAGHFARPALVLPLGGRPGEELEVRVDGETAPRRVTLPTAAGVNHGVAWADTPSPNWLRVSDLPSAQVVAQPAAERAKASAGWVPLACQGVLANAGEPAFFRFTARKDQNLDLQVFARRLGSPLDPVLTVLDAKGKVLGSNDDAAGHPDSALRVKVPADGDYLVKVADQLGRGGGTFGFRVEIREFVPEVVLSVPDTARYDYETRKSLVVPRGNRFAVLLNTTRDGFNGDLRVEVPGLPAGMTFTAETVPGGVSAVPVVLEAAADAPEAGALVRPVAAPAEDAKVPLRSRYRHAVDWVRIQNDTVYVRSEVDRMAAAVVAPVPFRITLVEPKVPLVQGGEMDLKVVVERDVGFDEPVTVRMVWNPPGVTSLPDMVIPKGTASVAYRLNAGAKADLRHWRTAVVGGATVEGGMAYVSSALTGLEVAPGYLLGRIDLTRLDRGGKGKLVCALEQKISFEGTAKAELVGLPAGVKAEPVEVRSDSTEAVFELVASDKAPVGTHKGLLCRVTVRRDGEPIPHLLATGSVLRIDAPRALHAAAR